MTNKFLPKTILSIDWGEKRIGVAIKKSDSMNVFGLDVLDNDNNFYVNFKKIINEYEPDFLVLGRPLNLEGEPTKQTKIIKDFAVNLAKNTNLDVSMQDETLSSEEASKRLNPKLSLKEKRRLINQLSAEIILEDFLR